MPIPYAFDENDLLGSESRPDLSSSWVVRVTRCVRAQGKKGGGDDTQLKQDSIYQILGQSVGRRQWHGSQGKKTTLKKNPEVSSLDDL